MVLSDGSTQEYEILKMSSIETYLLKLENSIDKIESLKKQIKELKSKTK